MMKQTERVAINLLKATSSAVAVLYMIGSFKLEAANGFPLLEVLEILLTSKRWSHPLMLLRQRTRITARLHQTKHMQSSVPVENSYM